MWYLTDIFNEDNVFYLGLNLRDAGESDFTEFITLKFTDYESKATKFVCFNFSEINGSLNYILKAVHHSIKFEFEGLYDGWLVRTSVLDARVNKVLKYKGVVDKIVDCKPVNFSCPYRFTLDDFFGDEVSLSDMIIWEYEYCVCEERAVYIKDRVTGQTHMYELEKGTIPTLRTKCKVLG